MTPELADATTLDALAARNGMRGLLPHLMRRLLASTPDVTRLVMPAEEGIAAPGYDGTVEAASETPWVPAGPSVWELGAGGDPRAKAQSDFETRTANPGPVTPNETVFVFVTPRRWAAGQAWADERRGEGHWRDVQVLDAERLHGWLETTPDVHVWLSERLGLRPLGVRTLSRVFDAIAARTRPPTPRDLLLAGRTAQAEQLRAALAGPPSAVAVRAGSREEAVAFMAAALRPGDSDHDVAGEQPLWVRDVDAFERLATSTRPLTLVVGIDGAEIGAAVSQGHHVLLALGADDYEARGAIALPRLARPAARDALDAAGLSLEQADRLAAVARRSFAAFQRELAAAPGGARPEWARGSDGPLLASLLLLGGWSARDGDAEVIAEVVGLSRSDVEERLIALSRGEDPPWTRSGGGWHLVSPDDAFALVGEFLDEALLERWRHLAIRVLSEPDPRVVMASTDRMIADARGESQPTYSQSLREGVARAAALLAGRATAAAPSGAAPAAYAVAIVGEALAAANDDSSGRIWSTLSDVLPLLAEAAPDAFLDAVSDGLAMEGSPVMGLFQDGPGFSPLFSSSPHTGLLWALEGVAWSSEHLTRATLALGELAARDPGGRLSNRPAGSLREIFLPWLPQSQADVAGRLSAIDALRHRHPEVAWKLELALLPRLHDSASPTHQPRFRDWSLERDRASPEEWLETIREIVLRVRDDAGDDFSRWGELVGHLGQLTPDERGLLIDAMAALDAEAAETTVRLALWRALVDEAAKHREFASADWALPEAEAAKLAELAEQFSDPAQPERHARLFDHRVPLEGVDRRDYAARQQELARLRAEAAADALINNGVDGLVALATASRLPRAVGWAAGDADRELPAEVLAMLAGEGAAAAMAAGWTARRIADVGLGWAEARVDSIAGLGIDGQAALLRELPFGPGAWAFAAQLGEEAEARYWRETRPFAVAGELRAEVVNRLLDHGRPWTAIDVLASVVHAGEEIDADLAERVLDHAVRSDAVDVEAAVEAAWEVGQILDALERQGLDVERLASFEFAFFGLLDDVRGPRALQAAIATDVALFTELVRQAHPRDDGAEEPDDARELAEHAWRILHDLRRLPGSDDEGRVAADRLHEWVDEARRQLADRGRAATGDRSIGELLARAPAGEDEIWPAEPVREVIERIAARALDEGLILGRLNARGPTWRDPYGGGNPERALASSLRDDARRLEAHWPRTARCLREIASSYDAQADHLDRQAERQSDYGS